MGVLEKLRIGTETDDEFPSEFDPESVPESSRESDYESNPNLDPSPGQAAPRKPSRAKEALSQVRDSGPRITKKMRDDCQNEVESIVQVVALAWGWQAPPCGDALEEVAPEFAEKLTKILARNPRWLMRVRDGGLIADVIQLFGTLAPVAKVAYAYYGAPKEENPHGGGVVFDPSQFQPYDGNGFSRAG
ncbi:hypothetical protein ACIRD9_42570 [Streptomyces violaceus]|uniref:hypothetical protein n=1 Tax=Streptomyces violaceus TaxID=1936 RepID=UPI0038244F37